MDFICFRFCVLYNRLEPDVISVKKVTLWHNSLDHKFENAKVWAFVSDAPIWKFQSVWVSIWVQINIHIDEKQTPSLPDRVCGSN